MVEGWWEVARDNWWSNFEQIWNIWANLFAKLSTHQIGTTIFSFPCAKAVFNKELVKLRFLRKCAEVAFNDGFRALRYSPNDVKQHP